jgi:hypothetical protein
MANGEFIEFLSPSALKDLQTANAELVTMISNVEKVGTKMKGITTPSGSDSAVKNINAKLIQQEKLYTDLQIKLERYAQAQQQTAIKTNQLEASTIRLNKAKELSIKQLEREQAKLEASLSLQAKTNAQLKKVQFAYDELALKKQRYNNLSANEEKRLVTLTSTLQKYRTIQDGVNTTVGKFQQRVGNYATAFNPLSNSINQLSREMPAFANSVQTGFMAISNNLPIFFDAMENAIAQQKELQKQGLPSKNALQLLAGSFFTLGTALSLGVTALTIFAPMLIKAITNSEQKTKAIEAEKKAREEQLQIEKQYADNLSKLASEEQAKSKIYLENAKNLNLPLKERIKNVELLQSRYPAYFGNLKQEEILAGNTAKAEYELNNALMKRALFLAVQDKIKETTKELVDAEFKYMQTQQKQIDTNNLYDKNLQATTKTKQKYRLVTEQEANSTEYLKKLEDDRNKSLQKGNVIQLSATDVLRKNTIVAKEKLEILYRILNNNAKYNSVVVEETKKLNDNTKAKKENNKEDEKKGEFLSKERLQFQISTLQKELELTSKLNPSYQFLSDTLKQVNALYDALYGEKKVVKAQEEIIDALELTDEAVYTDYFAWLKLKEATDSYIKTLSSDAFNKAFDNIGLSSAKMFFDFDANGQSTFDKLIEGADSFKEKFAITFQAVGDTAQDIFNKITELSNQRFQNELINLQQEKEVALLFAGESASAREEIERQYEVRQREIKRREFQAKKQQAIFNIVIDTAQGVVSALASTPPNVPLSIAIGAIGAVQAGLVASQQVPQFWKGTDNAPEGWALTQERGREIITDSKGNIKSLGNDKGAQYTYLNKGDKVLNNDKTMDYLMFNNDLNAMLTNNDIAMPKVNIEAPQIDLTPVIDAINNKESFNLAIDENGFRKLIKNGHTTKEILNRKVNFVGKSV